jgi:hypothetical protein
LKRNSESWPISEGWGKSATRASNVDGNSIDVFCSVYDYYAALLSGLTGGSDGGHNTVLTFNYDLLLEESLAALGIPFSYALGLNGVYYDPSHRCHRPP